MNQKEREQPEHQRKEEQQKQSKEQQKQQQPHQHRNKRPQEQQEIQRTKTTARGTKEKPSKISKKADLKEKKSAEIEAGKSQAAAFFKEHLANTFQSLPLPSQDTDTYPFLERSSEFVQLECYIKRGLKTVEKPPTSSLNNFPWVGSFFTSLPSFLSLLPVNHGVLALEDFSSVMHLRSTYNAI